MKNLVETLKDECGCYSLLNDTNLGFEFLGKPLLAICVYKDYSTVLLQGEFFKVENKHVVTMMKVIKMVLEEFKTRHQLQWAPHSDLLQITIGASAVYQLRLITNLKGLIMFTMSDEKRKDFPDLLFIYQQNFRMYEKTNDALASKQSRVMTKVHDALSRSFIRFNQEGNVFHCESGLTILCKGNHFQLVLNKQIVRVKIDLLTDVQKLSQYFRCFRDIAVFNHNNIKRVNVVGCYSQFIGVFYDEFLVYKGLPNGRVLYRLEDKINRILKEKKLHD
jgi:hypothetical protein